VDALRSRGVRRAQGAFFTPLPLVDFVVEEALDMRFAARPVEWHEDGYPLLRVLDPSAGDGRFLEAAMQSLLRRGTELGQASNEALVRSKCLVGIERDPDYAAIARENLQGDSQIHCAEALLGNAVVNNSVDVVVGNPPYLQSARLGKVDASLQSQLRGRYAATSHGEWDLYAAFLEQGLRWLREDGALGMVVPSRWWTAQWAGPLRDLMARSKSLTSLVDFGTDQIFSDATVYASLCFASTSATDVVTIARSQRDGWELGEVAQRALQGTSPWDLAIGTSRAIVAHLREQGPTLGSVARIAKGCGTNADSVFLIGQEDGDLEGALLHSVFRGRDVRAYGEVPVWPKLLLPYDENDQLISPEIMKARYPLAYAYLSAHRSVLEAREGGRFAGPTFYCFGRPQNFAFLLKCQAKVVVPDVTKQGRALVDACASLVLDSAYAIRLNHEGPIDHDILCGLLNSRLVTLWLASQGLPLRGGYTRMKTAYLRGLPLPKPGRETDVIGERVRKRAPVEEVDEQVRKAYGMSRSLWGYSDSAG